MTGSQPEQVQKGEGVGEPSGLGRALRRARMALGHDIPHIATTLRIRPEYLEALEGGDHAKLPGRVYAIGFVRTYSNFLGLDSAVAIERFKAEAVTLDHAHLQPPTPPPEGRVPGGALLFVSLVAAVVLYGGWWVMSADERRMPEIVAAVPEHLQKLVDVVTQARETMIVRLPKVDPSASTGPGTASAAAPMIPATPVAPQPLAQPASPAPVVALPDSSHAADDTETADSSDDDESSRPAPEYVGPATSSPPVASSSSSPGPSVAALPQTTAVAASETGPGRIVLRAREENWVQVRDGGNAPVMTRVLKPGDMLKVPERTGLTLMTGNAGGLDILVDGEAVPSLGAPGQVRRNVALDADKLKAGTAFSRP